ncbi:MAG TPA: hypothetical protein VMV71_00280 [Candidatus Paceibacterota bacterium]|nr:hypothetical protein [Candidatus Paceibacterota bacterium]
MLDDAFIEQIKKLGFDCAGKFFVSVDVVGEKSPRRQQVDFKPSPDAQTIVEYIATNLGDKANKVERLQIEMGGKKLTHFTGVVEAAMD